MWNWCCVFVNVCFNLYENLGWKKLGRLVREGFGRWENDSRGWRNRGGMVWGGGRVRGCGLRRDVSWVRERVRDGFGWAEGGYEVDRWCVNNIKSVGNIILFCYITFSRKYNKFCVYYKFLWYTRNIRKVWKFLKLFIICFNRCLGAVLALALVLAEKWGLNTTTQDICMRGTSVFIQFWII